MVREAVGDVAEIESDSVGNLVARRTGDGPLLALIAHLDVIGLAVAHIPDDALIAVHKLGGSRANIAYGQRVEIRTKSGPVHGVVARKVKDDEKVEWEQLYVDIGARDGKEARALVEPGDPMVVVGPPLELAGGRVTSRSLDDRAGVYVALEALRRLEGANVAVVATAQEELGADGARAAVHRLRPDVAIAIDVTYATDVGADSPSAAATTCSAAVPRSSAARRSTRASSSCSWTAAEEEGIDAHGRGRSEDRTPTPTSPSPPREGIPTGLVSIPLRNMHSPIEIVQLDDLESCIRLLVAFAGKLEPDATYAR